MVLNNDVILGLNDDKQNWIRVFSCPVCYSIPDLVDAVHTKCSHIFCANCIQTWMTRSDKCPTCQVHLNPSDILPLSQGNKLGYRVLGCLRVKCPLFKVGCKWVGDLSELHDHLTNSGDHMDEDTTNTSTTNNNSKLERENENGEELEGSRKKQNVSSSSPYASLNGMESSGNVPHANGVQSSLDANVLRATGLKEEGNERFKEHRYLEARELFSKAISICPKKLPELYLNRAAAHIKLKNYRSAIDDCDMARSLNPKLIKGYIRGASANLELGNIDTAIDLVDKALILIENDKSILSEQKISKQDVTLESKKLRNIQSKYNNAIKLISERKYADARQILSQLLQDTSAPSIMVAFAKVEAELGFGDRAMRYALEVLRQHPTSPDAFAVRARAIFVQGIELDSAIQNYKEALRLSPDDNKIAKEFKETRNFITKLQTARDLSEKREYSKANEIYTELLQDDNILPFHVSLRGEVLAERGNTYFRLNQHELALNDCTKAIELKVDSRRAWLTKIYTLQSLERFEEAVQVSSQVMETWGSNDAVIKGAHETAVFNLRKSRRPDFYGLLGVEQNASEAEIKRAYRNKSLFCHPDKVPQNASESEKKQAADIFHTLGQALEILADSFTRKLWDEGHDVESIKQLVARAAQRSHHHP